MLRLSDIKHYISDLTVTNLFIIASILSATLTYMSLGIIIDSIINITYTTIICSKILKMLTSFLISYMLKKTILDNSREQHTIILILLTILNLITIIASHTNRDYYNTLLCISSLSIITISIFTIAQINQTNYLNYYIDNKLITIAYISSVFFNSAIASFIFNLLMSLKLISVYNSTHFIIKNNLKYNYIYLLLIYFNIINRYIDINQMLY